MKFKLLQAIVLFAITYTLNSCSQDNQNYVPPSNLNAIDKNAAYTYSSSEIETMALINDYRVSVGLNPLKQNDYISLKAEEHNEQMITTNVVSHDGFVARSENIMSVLGAKKVAENIAYNYSTSQAALNAWLNSPTHKENLVGDFTHFGISIRLNAEGKKYYTNIFAKI